MMTATTRKTSFENKHLRSCDYFAVIPSCWHSTMLAKYNQTGLACAYLRLYAQVVVKTVNVRILRCCSAEDCTRLF